MFCILLKKSGQFCSSADSVLVPRSKPRSLTRDGDRGSPCVPSSGWRRTPGRAELTASAPVGHDVSFFWHHAHHNPSFPAAWFCRLLTFTKTGRRTFFTPWKCVVLCNSILSVHPASPTAIATFRESSTLGADLSRCECGCDFHQCP